MATTSLLAFWVVTLLLIVVPGADWAFTLTSTLAGQPVLAPVAGLVLGYAVLTAVVCTGVGALVGSTPVVLIVLTLVGAGYLVWQGIAILARPVAPTAAIGPAAATRRGTIVKGIGVSGLNPKALLLFLALLPQFTVAHGGWPITAQLAVLGCVFTITVAVFYLLLGTFVATMLHGRPAAARAVTRFSGVGMIIIGLLLVIERVITGWAHGSLSRRPPLVGIGSTPTSNVGQPLATAGTSAAALGVPRPVTGSQPVVAG